MRYIKTNKKCFVYDSICGKFFDVGTLNANQTFPLAWENSQYYIIKFANGYVHVQKSDADIVDSPDYQNGNPGLANSNTVVITKIPVSVYDNTSGSLVEFATVHANMRYPIISTYGPNWYKIDLGGRIGYIASWACEIDNGIPVLMYHHILRDEENTNFRNVSTTISLQQFEEQMQYLKDNGYRTVQLYELEGYLNRKENLTGKVVCITFDDGLKSNYIYAYPILKSHGFKATEFVISDRTKATPTPFDPATLQFLSYPEIEEMRDVFDFQGHTHSLHLKDANNKSYMIIKSYDEIVNDLNMNKQCIQPYSINQQMKYFAYPFGQYDTEAINALKATGFTMAFTTTTGNVKLGDTNMYTLKRQGITPSHTLEDFINIVTN